MRIFIKDYLGPALEESGLDTKLYLGTINGSGTLGGFGSKYNDYTTAVLDDEKALFFIKGVAYQWEGKQSLRPAVESYPELDYIQSENECGEGANSWEYACYVFELMRHYITGGVSAYCYWNPPCCRAAARAPGAGRRTASLRRRTAPFAPNTSTTSSPLPPVS